MEGLGRRCFMGCKFFTVFSLCEFYPAGKKGKGMGMGDGGWGMVEANEGNRLLFMTYNGWVMISVAVGSAIGYIIWGGSEAAKSVACH